MGSTLEKTNTEAAATLTKAVKNVAGLFQLKQSSIAKILGVSTATASRLFAGAYVLSQERSKEWEFAVLLIRLFRSLDAVLGHGDNARKWLNGNNLALAGRPVELVETTEGLVRVLHYVDAHRGRI